MENLTSALDRRFFLGRLAGAAGIGALAGGRCALPERFSRLTANPVELTAETAALTATPSALTAHLFPLTGNLFFPTADLS
jgi:hypothetical protein